MLPLTTTHVTSDRAAWHRGLAGDPACGTTDTLTVGMGLTSSLQVVLYFTATRIRATPDATGVARFETVENDTREAPMNVAELMTREVISVGPDATLKEVARLLVEHRISGVPVCDDTGRVIGIVSEGDILQREAGSTTHEGILARLFDDSPRLDARKTQAVAAHEAMTTPAITIGGYRSATAAARKMLDHGVNRLPVVDMSEKLAGILTRADLVRAFVRTDEQIASEIENDVLARILWAGPHQVKVEVAGGEVTLTGSLETDEDVEMLQTLVTRVLGVVAVHSSVLARGAPVTVTTR